MRRKEAQFPWRVLALSGVLFISLAFIGWLVFGVPGGATSPPVTGDVGTAIDPAGTTTAPPPAVIPAAPQGDPLLAEGIDPTTPEGRAALAEMRARTGTMDLRLFLIVPGIERLIPVPRTVAAPMTIDAQVRLAVEELIRWNGTETISPLASQTRVRETWVSPGGIAYIDFDRSFYDFSGSGSLGELHSIYGIVATITLSFPEIVAVQFLIDGEIWETLAGHVDLTRPLLPSDEWVLIEPAEQQIQQLDEPA